MFCKTNDARDPEMKFLFAVCGRPNAGNVENVFYFHMAHWNVPKSGRRRRTATDPSEVQSGPRKPFDSKSWAALHRFTVPCEHAGPAARSLRFALLELPGLGALSSVHRANVRSRSEIREFASNCK